MIYLLLLALSSFIIILLIFIYHYLLFNITSLGLNQSVWSSSFECGFSGHSININNFSVSFFILLVFFVVFDLEISLLLNMPVQPNLFKNFFFYYFFLILIVIGYLLEVFKGFVNWQN
uniref:NADH-ubiquinone oxidoreductase chain 3 n=1 Tax=Benedenia hoshinai TaxID=407255 RepID=E1U261_BENHO|nr:NADH dehydrogenase subunit 3 [Benedenia hoshinai]ABK58259.1 NADH dehydrogenase subunit 3 [Benedenia hoshinai]